MEISPRQQEGAEHNKPHHVQEVPVHRGVLDWLEMLVVVVVAVAEDDDADDDK